MKGIRLIIIIICAVSLSDCKKGSDEHLVPAIAVNLNISTNLAQYNDLNFIGGWIYLEGGYNGILVYRATNEDFKAYDRQAPYEVINECQVRVDSSDVVVEDTCSGSLWLLQDGQILNGPAAYPLKEYQTYYDGTVLSITN